MDKLITTPPPHLKAGNTVPQAMCDVLLALIPVSIVSIYFYQVYAAVLIVVCVATAVLTEIVFRRALGKEHTLHDLSAVVTGLLVALWFSAATPWWIAVVATILAVGVAKEAMGGTGWNLFNPALFGYAAATILAPWLAFLSRGLAELSLVGPDVLAETVLPVQEGLVPMLLTFPGGALPETSALAETSAVAVLIGAVYLLIRGRIDWRIPVSIVGSVFVLAAITGNHPVYDVLIGGLLLGAFFNATDWVTSPVDNQGKWIFGIGIGVLVAVFRFGLGAAGGVAFAILIMNAFVPLIERVTRRAPFGESEPSMASDEA